MQVARNAWRKRVSMKMPTAQCETKRGLKSWKYLRPYLFFLYLAPASCASQIVQHRSSGCRISAQNFRVFLTLLSGASGMSGMRAYPPSPAMQAFQQPIYGGFGPCAIVDLVEIVAISGSSSAVSAPIFATKYAFWICFAIYKII